MAEWAHLCDPQPALWDGCIYVSSLRSRIWRVRHETCAWSGNAGIVTQGDLSYWCAVRDGLSTRDSSVSNISRYPGMHTAHPSLPTKECVWSAKGGTEWGRSCARHENSNSPWCWQLLTRWPRTHASQAYFSPSIIMMGGKREREVYFSKTFRMSKLTSHESLVRMSVSV